MNTVLGMRQLIGWSDQAGCPHREVFFDRIREHCTLSSQVGKPSRRYRKRVPHLVRCRPAVMEGPARLRASGRKVAIVTNGTADNQLGKI